MLWAWGISKFKQLALLADNKKKIKKNSMFSKLKLLTRKKKKICSSNVICIF